MAALPGTFYAHYLGRLPEKLGLPKKMVFHDLRGSWVTWLVERKVDMKAASQLLGHTDERTTRPTFRTLSE